MMRDFAALLDRLVFTPSRNGKVRLLTDYFSETPDPARGYALAAIAGALDLPHAKPAMIRGLVESRVDPVLFRLSYDYVGDLAETLSLIWPADRAGAAHGANRAPDLADVVIALNAASKADTPGLLAAWFDAGDAQERWALIKLITGGLRVGVSARLVKTALAELGGKAVEDIEELWHGLEPPYESLFAWLEGRAEKPRLDVAAPFRPVMLAQPLDETRLGDLNAEDFCAEWKWDGARVQAVSEDGARRLYSRAGEDMSRAFPDIVEALDFNAALDGELLIYDPDATPFQLRPFSELQKRLNRKTVSKKRLRDAPAFVRVYDALILDGEDLRATPFHERRARLERWFEHTQPARMDLSPLAPFASWPDLAALRAAPATTGVEGVMIKRRDSAYIAGRPTGPWWKWKRDPFLIDAVLMYAQRGHGRRSSYYSDYTFGVRRNGEAGPEITPVGKAYFGFTDEELKLLDDYVRANTVDRFGPVRVVDHGPDKGLVLEVAFEGLNRSTRHKSGLAMRFPRIHRIRWYKPAAEADTLASLEALLPAG